jgi:tRNA 2-selenouridine synthase
LERFEQPYSFQILGGYTGSGKTEILKQLEKEKRFVIDLEGIAHHKGSAFGGLGQVEQPTQEMFENELALKLYEVYNVAQSNVIWLEDESSRIGSINLSPALWKAMRQSPVYFLDIPFDERLEYITREYGRFEKKELISSIIRIQKRLGGQNTKDAISHILDGNIKESFRILLCYYDKYYVNGMQERDGLISVIACESVDVQKNISKLLSDKTIV